MRRGTVRNGDGDKRKRVRVIVALGQFAYDAVARVLAALGAPLPVPRPRFGHGLEVHSARAVVLCCYHPSQQNTFTGKLTETMLDEIFLRARGLADGSAATRVKRRER